MKADKNTVSQLLKTARGQIDGILKMVEDDRYCIDIVQQVMAAEAMLRKVQTQVLSAHMKTCVKNAQTDAEKEEKIDELIQIMTRISK
ncbi:MAG: metal-sensing transcriptional repressor [Clostridia bacterium]|nr:metal-sensing transcriptional repressor [Clostridia bacterium]